MSTAKAKSMAEPGNKKGKQSQGSGGNFKDQAGRSRSPIERKGVRSPPRPRMDMPRGGRGPKSPTRGDARPRTPERRSTRPRSPACRHASRTAGPREARDSEEGGRRAARQAQLRSRRPSRSRATHGPPQATSPRRRDPPGERTPVRKQRGRSRQARRAESQSSSMSSPSPPPADARGGRAARGSVSDAGQDDAEGADFGDSDSAKGCSEAEPDGRVNLSPVPGCSLVEASRNCVWSQGMLVRTITQKWRPH